MARIIAMDEVGNFERRHEGVRFLGGFVKDEDYVLAKEHVENFLKRICSELDKKIKKINDELNVRYPNSLHGSGAVLFKKVQEGNKEKYVAVLDGEYEGETKKFKKEIQEKVIEYLKEHSYKLFMYLDPYTGGGYDDDTSDINITDLSQGANRYERMAVQALYNQILYAFDKNAEEYIFEIATRTLNPNSKDAPIEGAADMYSQSNGRFKVTNTSTYKTAIATMLYEKGINSKAKYVFHVEPINYNNRYCATTPFTYVADIVCSYLRGMLQEQFDMGIETTTNVITSKGLIELLDKNKDFNIDIYVYSEVDSKYRQMVESVKSHELVKYYELQYELKQEEEDNYKKFYIEKWIKRIDEEIQGKLKTSEVYKKKFRNMIDEYIIEIEGYMGIREIAYEKGLFIAKKFIRCIMEQENWERKNWAFFRLYDIILRGYNHRGAVDKVKEYVEKCDDNKSYVSVEEYVAHILRVVIYYANSLDYKKALEAAQKLEKIGRQMESTYNSVNSVCNDILSDIVENVNPVQTWQSPLLGKIYSNLGQAYAFCNDFENSKKAFETALKKFDKSSDNYKITLSYYLHLLIEHGERELYEEKVIQYLGSSSLETQMNKAFEYNSFAILIFIKAFSKFYVADHASLHILNQFVKEVEQIEKSKRSEHPWELIYMHLSESLWSIDWEKASRGDYYQELALQYGQMCWYECNKNADTTIILIQLNAQLRFMKLSGKVTGDGKLEGFRKKELENCEKILGLKQPITYGKLKRVLDEKITYMYR